MSTGKPRSQRSSAAPEDSSNAAAAGNRRARRREKQKQDTGSNGASPTADATIEAGPSRPHSAGPSKPSSKSAKEGKRGGDPSFAENADFIAFGPEEDGEKDKEKSVEKAARDPSPPAREWDKGKGKGKGKERARDGERDRGRDGVGRKRRADEVDLEDGYASKKERVAAASRRAPWARDVDWDGCSNVAELLHHEVQAFVDYMSPTNEEDELRTLTVALIAGAIKKQFPDAQVLPFGSYETKLYLPLGDIDLVIYSDQMRRFDKQPLLHSLANIMKRSGITDRVNIIAKARVPIIKFVTTHGRFPVDISVNQGNGVTTGQMVKQFLQELPALRSLVLVIKNFLSQRSMNEVFTGGLGSYSIVCMAISFLQMHPKIRRGEIDPSLNLGVLVMEFFELYGSYFNYQEVGISLRDGGSYYNKRARGWFDAREPRLLSIEDPGDPTNDISRGSYNFARVRTTLAGAHGIMAAAAFAKASMISARREGRTVRLRGAQPADPEEMSILGSVMGVTQETINHRRVVQEVYDRQVLHRMLGVAPQASVSAKAAANSGAVRMPESRSVASAWGEADIDVSLDSEAGDGDGDKDAGGEEEESRYEIERRRQPPKKRRRTGSAAEDAAAAAVYTTDDEDESQAASVTHHGRGGADGVSEEEEAYQVSDLGAGDQDGDGERANRRSYWLSKAMAAGTGDFGDDD